MRHQDIEYNVTGQSLVWDCPEGRPSAVTSATVYSISTGDDGTAETATTGIAAVETNPNTTIDAATGFGQSNPRVVYVAATTGFAVGRDYLITSADGAKEWFRCVEIDSGVSVTAAYPLQNAFASADTVQSTRISISVLDAFIQDVNNVSDDMDPNPSYRVRWQYTVGGVEYVHDGYFDVVRYTSGHSVSPADMEAFVPNWQHNLPTYHQHDQGRRLIDEAFNQVRWDLHESDKADEMLRSADGIDELVKHRAWVQLELAQLQAGQGDTTGLDLALRMYRSRLDQLVRVVSRLPESTSTSGAATIVPAGSIWEK